MIHECWAEMRVSVSGMWLRGVCLVREAGTEMKGRGARALVLAQRCRTRAADWRMQGEQLSCRVHAQRGRAGLLEPGEWYREEGSGCRKDVHSRDCGPGLWAGQTQDR